MKPGNAGGGKRPQLEANARSDEDGGIDVSLTTPVSVQKLQTALYAKAKESPGFRFYALYDKVYRKDVLAFAHERCKANGGAAGVDGQTFADVEAYGVERWLDEMAQELENQTYQRAGGNHICTRVYRVRSYSQGNNERKPSNFSCWKLTMKDSEPADLPRGCVSDPRQLSG